MSVGNTFSFQFLSTLTFVSNQFLSIYYIYSLDHIFTYTSFGHLYRELNFFLGLQINQLKEGTFINQAKYIRDLLKKFNLEEVKANNTPMGSSIKLDMDEKGKSVDQTKYRGMIGSLLYLTASTTKNQS